MSAALQPKWSQQVNAVKLVASLLVAALAVYLAIANASYWIWVANSAFRGIRVPANIGLGAKSVVLAMAATVIGGGVFLISKRRRPPAYRPVACGAGATLAVVVPAILYGIPLSGPF